MSPSLRPVRGLSIKSAGKDVEVRFFSEKTEEWLILTWLRFRTSKKATRRRQCFIVCGGSSSRASKPIWHACIQPSTTLGRSNGAHLRQSVDQLHDHFQ
jgi:hypothetical protein